MVLNKKLFAFFSLDLRGDIGDFDINKTVRVLDRGLFHDLYYWEAEPFLQRIRVAFCFCNNIWWTPAFVTRDNRYPTGRAGDNFSSHSTGPRTFNVFGSFALDNDPFQVQGLFSELCSKGATQFCHPAQTFGPKKACLDPIIPLTNIRSNIETAIARMAPWIGNGTTANLGAVWGWRALSPAPPFTEGSEYNDASFNKILVILTDGQNFVSSGDLVGRMGNSNICQRNYTLMNSHYTAYRYASDLRLGGNGTGFGAQLQLNQKLRRICEHIKETGITIYTITVQLNDTLTKDLFRECASDPGKFFNSPDNEILSEAFRSIGAEVSNLLIGR
jgi:hypothetical protein